MSRFIKVMVALLAIAAIATPAMAELKLNGYFRTQMITQELSTAKEDNATTMVDQRLRIKLSYDVNENITVVQYTEIDTPWGQVSKGSIGGGGKAGADGVNIETKNANVTIKIPNTSLKTTVGIQTFTLGFDGAIIFNDLAGLTVTTKLSDTADLVAGYFKGDNGVASNWDDMDIWAAKLNLKLAEKTKVGVALMWVDNNAGDADDDNQQFYLAAQGSADMGGVGVAGAAGYMGGSNGNDDLSGHFATVKVTAKAGMAALAARVLYYSGGDDETDAFWGDVTGGAYDYYGEGSEIFLTSASYNNSGSPRLALNAAYSGYGLIGVVASAKMNYDGGMYSMIGGGYYMAVEKNGKDDTDLGYEIDATVGTKIAEKADISLTAAYAGLGDFYADQANDTLYKINAMLNVSF